MADETTVQDPFAAAEATLRERFGEAVGERRERAGDIELAVAPPALADVAGWLHEELGLNHLVLLGGVDRLTHLEVVYLLDAMPAPPAWGRLWLRVAVEREAPRVPSVAGVWSAANYHERECYDLLGVVFDGHPDLRRIVLPDVWEGYPLRKDYRYDTDTMVEEILVDELGSAERRRL